MHVSKVNRLRNQARYANAYLDAVRTITKTRFSQDWRPKDPRINPPLKRMRIPVAFAYR